MGGEIELALAKGLALPCVGLGRVLTVCLFMGTAGRSRFAALKKTGLTGGYGQSVPCVLLRIVTTLSMKAAPRLGGLGLEILTSRTKAIHS